MHRAIFFGGLICFAFGMGLIGYGIIEDRTPSAVYGVNTAGGAPEDAPPVGAATGPEEGGLAGGMPTIR